MLRVTTIADKGSRVLKLEGKLGGPWVDELRHCWQALVTNSQRSTIQIDLRGLNYVDQRGRTLLLRMEREGASLTECSDFIRHVLHANDAAQKTARRITKKAKKENEHAGTLRS